MNSSRKNINLIDKKKVIKSDLVLPVNAIYYSEQRHPFMCIWGERERGGGESDGSAIFSSKTSSEY